MTIPSIARSNTTLRMLSWPIEFIDIKKIGTKFKTATTTTVLRLAALDLSTLKLLELKTGCIALATIWTKSTTIMLDKKVTE